MTSGGAFRIFVGAVIVAGILGVFVAWCVVPKVSWGAMAGGWGVAVINSVAAREFNRRAMGGSKGAFVGWGIVGNVFRMLTLVGIFAYILISYREERGSFFVSAFTVFFILMLVEVKRLFQSQANSGSRIE
jgi:hypothetical protein